MSRRIKNWMVTLPVQQAGQDHSKLINEKDEEEVHYAVWQEEKGDNSTTTNPLGYRHIQLYIEFTRPRTFDQAKEFLGEQAHIEIPKKVRQACINYCKKEDTRVTGPWEFGDVNEKNQGKRSDLDEIKYALDTGSSTANIAANHFSSWVRYRKSFDEYRNVIAPQRDGESAPHVIIVWGAAGLGKSRWAFLRDPKAYRAMPGKRGQVFWFDRYTGEDTVVFDDFTDDQCSLQEFCRWCDPYPLMVQTKGSTANFRPREIIFTSNQDPDTWWNSSGEMVPQVYRRTDHVIKLESGGDGRFPQVCFTPCEKCTGWEKVRIERQKAEVEIVDLLSHVDPHEIIDLTGETEKQN